MYALAGTVPPNNAAAALNFGLFPVLIVANVVVTADVTAFVFLTVTSSITTLPHCENEAAVNSQSDAVLRMMSEIVEVEVTAVLPVPP